MFVCVSVVQAFSPLEPEQLVRSGRANIHSMHWNSGKAKVYVVDRSVAHGTCHARSRKPLQKSIGQRCRPNQWTDSAQTWWADSHHGGGYRFVWGWRWWRLFGTCERQMARNLTLMHFAPERLVRLGREIHRSTRSDDGKITLSIIEGPCFRIPPDA